MSRDSSSPAIVFAGLFEFCDSSKSKTCRVPGLVESRDASILVFVRVLGYSLALGIGRVPGWVDSWDFLTPGITHSRNSWRSVDV